MKIEIYIIEQFQNKTFKKFLLTIKQKERDLELAARIGQNLLSDNQKLRVRNDELDTLLHQANEKVGQEPLATFKLI